jgi:hypothetical protein
MKDIHDVVTIIIREKEMMIKVQLEHKSLTTWYVSIGRASHKQLPWGGSGEQYPGRQLVEMWQKNAKAYSHKPNMVPNFERRQKKRRKNGGK